MARRLSLATLIVALVAGMVGAGAGAASASKPEVQKTNHGHEFKSRDAKNIGFGIGNNPNLINHGGPILTSSIVQAIYWGNQWTNSGFIGDKQSGLDSFYTGWTNSNYSGTTTEYSSSNGKVSGGVTYNGHLTDTSNGPASPPSTAQIVAEVLKMVPSPAANGYYPVYVDLKRGNAGYCAWHDTGSYTNSNNTIVHFQVAFFFNLDNDAGCDPQDTTTGHDEPLAALANVSGHELSEAETDPQLNAWYDRQGYENADKCAWHFNKISTFSNGSKWKIQGNWSNNAYNNRTGYYNRGCIDGN
jgi:hypothetical protein